METLDQTLEGMETPWVGEETPVEEEEEAVVDLHLWAAAPGAVLMVVALAWVEAAAVPVITVTVVVALD